MIKAAFVAVLAGAAWAGAALAQPAPEAPRARFTATMNAVFGPGKWRMTGGFRTPERENELRAQGALTVRAGVLSRHSMGRPDAPGAYDLVVDGLSPDQAASRLRRAGTGVFRTIFAEGAHGTQGPHLHVEPYSPDFGRGGVRAPGLQWVVVAETEADRGVTRLREAAVAGFASAQLQLGEIYAEGREAPRDLTAAYVWTALAAANPRSDADTRADAAQALAVLGRQMKADELQRARRFATDPMAGGGCPAAAPADREPIVLVLAPADAAASSAACASGAVVMASGH